MYPDNKRCGSGRYRMEVMDILRALDPARRIGFFLNPHGGPRGSAILCGCYYQLGDFAAFPVKTAADDLVWLIRNTLKSFAKLS